jgi:hypothetical protein
MPASAPQFVNRPPGPGGRTKNRTGFNEEAFKGIGRWTNNWGRGLSLITLTIAVHATALAFMALILRRIWVRAESPGHQGLRRQLLTMIVMITLVGLLLAFLHGIEARLWAASWWLGALGSASDAPRFSVDSMSTRGPSALTLEHRWHMMGALEAMDGMLLFGISTAFIFAVIAGIFAAYEPAPPTLN